MEVRIPLIAALLFFPAAAAEAQDPPPLVSDRPGFLFGVATVGRGTFQLELGLPAWTLVDGASGDRRLTQAVGALRYGVSDKVELRLGLPSWSRLDPGAGRKVEGFGDLELGLKWQPTRAEGGRPALIVVPSVILDTGDDAFTAGQEVGTLAIEAEWVLPDGAAVDAMLQVKRGSDELRETTAALLWGKALDARWSYYFEGAWVNSDPGDAEALYAGAGVKRLIGADYQLDLYLDRGLSDDAADWLVGFGLVRRFRP